MEEKKELRARCMSCNELTPLSQLTRLELDTGELGDKNQRVCNSCLSAYRCYDCGMNRLSTRAHTICDFSGDIDGHYNLCDTCNENNYTECDCCGDVRVHNSYGNVCSMCEDGDENEDSDNEFISTRINYRDVSVQEGIQEAIKNRGSGDVIKSPRLFGVEFEIVTKRRNIIGDEERTLLNKTTPSKWGICTDASLPSNGIEVNTCPMSLSDSEKQIRDFTNSMSKLFTVSDRCGTHVHIDGSDLNESYLKLKRSIYAFIIFDDIFLEMLPVSRRSNRYCSPLSYARAVINRHQEFSKGMSIEEFMASQTRNDIEHTFYKTKNKDIISRTKRDHYAEPRYHGINFHSLFNGHNTIENRYLEGTIDSELILNWVALNQHIIDTCRIINNDNATKLISIKNVNDRLNVYAGMTGMSKELLDFCNKRINQFK